jgi:spermidine synthase
MEDKSMQLWFSEAQTPFVDFSLKINKVLYTGESEHQRIDVLESKEFGRVLTQNGQITLTEKDEFIYREMMVHVPLAVNPDIKKVLIIGAGDGGFIHDLLEYPTIEHIDLVESDPMIVDVCKEYLPEISSKLDDEKVTIFYEDALRFVRRKENEYDLILVDSVDPFGAGEILFTKEFYGNCYRALTEAGILINQHESPFYAEEAATVQTVHRRIVQTFPIVKIYQAHIPSYPSGHWLFGFASKKLHPTGDLKAESWHALNLKTKYYNTRLHVGAFALPTYVEDLLKNVE